MYSGGPPTAVQPGRSTRFTRATRRVFEGMSDLVFDPELRVFLADMVRPYGLPLRDDLLTHGAGHSYGEMAERLIKETVHDDEPVDLLVLAFGIHDIRLGRATAAYLSHVCPGDPMPIALCDQGAAAAYTGVRLIDEYTKSGACSRALLVLAEQSALHYQPAGPAVLPDRHTAVALLCEQSAVGGPTVVRQHADVSPGLVGALLADEVAVLTGGRADVTLVLGGGLADVGHGLGVESVVRAPAGQPFTGPWWELAGGLAGWRGEGRLVVLAEYDVTLGYLSLSSVDLMAPVAVA